MDTPAKEAIMGDLEEEKEVPTVYYSLPSCSTVSTDNFKKVIIEKVGNEIEITSTSDMNLISPENFKKEGNNDDETVKISENDHFSSTILEKYLFCSDPSSIIGVKGDVTEDSFLVDVQGMKRQQQPVENYVSFDPVRSTKSPINTERMMKDDVLRKIAGVLAANNDSYDVETKFCTEETLPAENINICVENVGNLQFPLHDSCIEKLIAVSSADAQFGFSDNDVCNTQVIESRDFNVSIAFFDSFIEKIGRTLNLPFDSILKPYLNNMIIYSPGQSFNDKYSEKLDNMVATLMVVLPSQHIGGNLIIKHNDKKYEFSSENLKEKDARCICFFSDCAHEVQKIKDGYRVVLTYNVVLERGQLLDTSVQNKYLEDCLRDYFTESKETKPKKLVILLNHSYSEYSLKWNLLEREDLQYARLICSAAKTLDLETHLGLVSITQMWTCDQYKKSPMEFIESSENVVYWVDENNKNCPYTKYSVPLEEICFTKETDHKAFKSIDEEFTEPSDKEEATIDYWFKRAGIVLWRQSDSLRVQFELNYQNTLNSLVALVTEPGNEEKVKEVLKEAGKLILSSNSCSHFHEFAQLALYVNDEETAFKLLSQLSRRVIIPDNSRLLVEIQEKYGLSCFSRLIRAIMANGSITLMDFKQLSLFIGKFLKLGGELSIMQTLVENAVTSFFMRMSPVHWKTEVVALLKACVLTQNLQLLERLIQFLISKPGTFDRDSLIKIYLHLKQLPEYSGKYASLQQYLVQEIKLELNKHPPSNDWSVKVSKFCDCDTCNITVQNFLASNERITRIEKIGKIRRHLSCKGLPIDLSVEGKGKDVFLILKKRNKILIDAAANRSRLTRILLSLTQSTVTRKRVVEQTSVKEEKNASPKRFKCDENLQQL